ncbi:MAG: hypothetical protein AAGA08_04670 [Pseudomonadota bacterium]
MRFVLYTLIAIAAFSMGLDEKTQPVSIQQLGYIVLLGLGVIALPLYLVQKAIPLVSTSVIALTMALGPILVFAMQAIEGRVAYSSATLLGLGFYMAGCFVCVFEARKPQHLG